MPWRSRNSTPRAGEDSGFEPATKSFWARLPDGLELRFVVEEIELAA
jgi:hypothetical protein